VLGLAAITEPMAPNGLRALAVAVFCAEHRIEVDDVTRRTAQRLRLSLVASRSSAIWASAT
jgi:hypothetical protein